MSTRLLMALAVLALSTLLEARQGAVTGTWKLVSYVTETPDGKRTFPLGGNIDHLEVSSAPNYVGIAGQTSASTLIWERIF